MKNRNLFLLSIFLLFSTASTVSGMNNNDADRRQRVIDTGLTDATEMGKLNNVKFFLNQNATINYIDENEFTPLLYACKNGHLEIVKTLVEHGAIIEAVPGCHQNLTPLHMAACRGQTEIMAYLLSKGANLQAMDSEDSWTPLCWACDAGNINAANFILQVYHNKNLSLESLTLPIVLACLGGHIQLVKFLFRECGKTITQDEKNKILLESSEKDHPKIAQFLIDQGANVNVSDEKNVTPLHLACQNGCLELVKLLVKKNVDVNAKTISGIAPLHIAAGYKHLEICKILLSKKANVHATIDAGLNVLDCVDLVCTESTEKAENIIKLLVRYGATRLSEEEANQNMQNFLAELNEEKIAAEAQAEKKRQRVKNKRKKQQRKALQGSPQGSSSETNSPEISDSTVSSIPSQESTAESNDSTETINTPPALETNVETKIEQPITIVSTQDQNDAEQNVSTLVTSCAQQSAQGTQQPKKLPVRPTPTTQGYLILIHEKFKWPQSLRTEQRAKMLTQLKLLKNWPNCAELDIKALKGSQQGSYRLRVGTHRVIFSADVKSKEIKIYEIALRKSVYKHLK